VSAVPPATPTQPMVRIALSTAVTLTTVTVVVGFAVVLFFNPLWISYAQDRAGVTGITGYTADQVREATGSILADLFLGAPRFDAVVDGRAVLGADERSHMVDVRNVVLPLAALLMLAAAALVGIVGANRRRAWPWRAVARGSGVLTIVGVVVGIAVVFFFDAAFLLFHLVFFPQGNFTFDPRTQRLTQLFPDQFWTETSIGIAVVGLTTSIVVTLVARRRAARLGG
jgi:integral membrane protein (TIGR01906 family)